MKLFKLGLRNFKGRTFDLVANGQNLDIFGDNATGKTTLFDALCWLLTDKDSQNKKDFAIKNLDAAGKEAHNMEHEVSAVLEIDGQETALRKVYAEKWTKKRGSVAAEFSGHETSYWINEVPKPKKDYDAFINGIANESVFKLLTNPAYFNEQLHWQDRRKILLEICGDVSDADVIASYDKLSKLPKILGNRSLDDHRKVIAERRKKINEELTEIPNRIDEVTRGLPIIDDLPNSQVLQTEIVSLRNQQKAKQQELARIEAGGDAAEKQKRLHELEGQMQQFRNKYRAENEDAVFEKRRQLQGLQFKLSGIHSNIVSKNRDIESSRNMIADHEQKRGELRDDWYKADEEVFTCSVDDTCPTCGQPLPSGKVEAAQQEAEEAFNIGKSRRLEGIELQGVELGKRIDGFHVLIDKLQTEVDDLSKEKSDVEQQISALQSVIDGMGTSDPFENTPSYQRLSRDIAAMQADIAALADQQQSVIRRVQTEISLIGQDIASREKQLLLFEQRNKGLDRIKELEQQEKELSAEFQRLEGELYLTEQFVQAKVKLLTDKINSRFKMARFKLFDIQINGGLVETCETTYNGVPYSSGLNNAARINVGLDIINTLSAHYGFEPPIFIDNAESVTGLIETRAQIIRLVVSKPDKALRVETADQAPMTLFKEVV